MPSEPGETRWPAPAKINRFLHILGRRADGYHTLQTLFQFLDRCDTVSIRLRDDGVIRRQDELPDVPPESDLTLRAAHALQRVSGAAAGAEIGVRKRLPAGGGLGGGSSDAATTLVALNHLWGCGLDAVSLAELGLTLGADVPVFVHGSAAWAEGVGEHLEPVILDQPWYVVLAPACHVSTAELFRAPELTRNTAPITIADLPDAGRNDFESVVRARYPAVEGAFAALAPFGRPRLTGSGGCVFLACATAKAAGQAWRSCRAGGWAGFIARGLNRSPLAACDGFPTTGV